MAGERERDLGAELEDLLGRADDLVADHVPGTLVEEGVALEQAVTRLMDQVQPLLERAYRKGYATGKDDASGV